MPQRENVTQNLIIVSLLLSLTACRYQKIHHDPMIAASETTYFLRALYFDKDCAGALRLADEQLRQSVTADDLKKLVDEGNRQGGTLKSLTADSYLMTPGATMQIYYTGKYEKGVLYYRLALVGDASSGYRVSGIWFQPQPYPDSPLRRKFEVDITLQE